MYDVSIALNRFGLGARPGESQIDPLPWLLSQLEEGYIATPAPIDALPNTQTISQALADRLATARGVKRRGYGLPPSKGNPVRNIKAEREEVADTAMMQNGRTTQDADPRDSPAQARMSARQDVRDLYANQVHARTLMAVTSPTPFVERLVHFWANHFAVSIDKFAITGLAGQLEFDAIRPHVLGNFRDMLFAVERHPAMLLYLDQTQSIGPGSPEGQIAARHKRGKQSGLNENLAREILELHTLGVRTGYTQADVTEFARAMTGWTVAGLTRGTPTNVVGTDGAPGDFVFAERLHEPGDRRILAQTWSQPGYAQAEAVLKMLAVHPSTARHIGTKLARHFAGDDPPPRLIAELEGAFLKSGGDLRSVYRVLIEAPECWTTQPLKFKTPWEWMVSALRALGADEVGPVATFALVRKLGQPTWQPGSPAGWDDVTGSWAGPDAIMRRVEAAERIAARSDKQIDARQRATELFPGGLGPATMQAISGAESPKLGVALMLVAPEFMRR